jgi:isoquinoline 1-oxidoreductase beta subunit
MHGAVSGEGRGLGADAGAADVPRCRGARGRRAGRERDVHVTLLGGGFGRRLEVDYVAQAVRVAMDAGGVPVQLLWSREEDTTHDFYRPMQVARLRR